MQYLKIIGLSLLLQFCWTPVYASDSADEAEIWRGIADGRYFAMMRHAIAPGVGDPQEFDLVRCETQRNLSVEGVEQAIRIGDQFRARGISSAAVHSSQWCRCIDTAKAIDLGVVNDLRALNSFFRKFEERTSQTQALLHWLRDYSSDQPLLLVTHQVNISALLGVGATSGEIVAFMLNEEGLAIPVGSIMPP